MRKPASDDIEPEGMAAEDVGKSEGEEFVDGETGWGRMRDMRVKRKRKRMMRVEITWNLRMAREKVVEGMSGGGSGELGK